MKAIVDRTYFARRALVSRSAARATHDMSANRAHQAFAVAYEALVASIDTSTRLNEAGAARSRPPVVQAA